jgi:hypothetical protein
MSKSLKTKAKSFRSGLEKLLTNAKLGKKISDTKFFLTIGDISDLMTYCSLIESGKFRAAAIWQDNLDSDCSEKIPKTLYKDVGEYDNRIEVRYE